MAGSLGPAEGELFTVDFAPGLFPGEPPFEERRVCIKPEVGPEEWRMIELFWAYEAGHYPFSGGLLEQPAWYPEAMNVISMQQAFITRRETEKRRGGR